MARRTRVPFLVDVIRVSEPEMIRSLPDHGALDRHFDGTGPLVNRLIAGRLRAVLRTSHEPLPSALPRDHAARAAAQAALTERLSADEPERLLDQETLAALAGTVRGEAGAQAQLTQQLVGRLFIEGYRATPETWAAAVLLQDAAESNNPVKQLIRSLTGQVTAAQKVLSEAAGGDPAAVHSTAIAVHNLVVAMGRLTALYSDPAKRASLGSDAVLAHALVGPKSIVRQAARDADSLAGRLRPGTLAVFSVREAGQRSLDPRVTFMADSWSACPAHRLVPAAIAAVWARAVAD